MKNFKKFLTMVAFVALGSATLVSCKKDDEGTPDPQPGNIVEIASANPDFSILVAAVQRAGLASVLSGPGPFTVFAPTNDAFADLLEELGFANLEAIPVPLLTQVLLYHVVSGEVPSSAVTTGYVPTNADGVASSKLQVYVQRNGANITLDSRAAVTAADIEASNGVIHVIDKVILPNDLVGAAIANPNFSILVQAVVKANLVDALKGLTGATLFAPTNDAFVALLGELGFASLDDVPVPTLTNILLYHVFAGAPVKAADVTTGYVPSLSPGPNSSTVSIYLEKNGGVKIDNRATVIAADVITTNGVIHAIDKVILPNKIVQMALNDASFSSLVAALVHAELVDAVNGDGPLTVFAPTNAAFAALLTALGADAITDVDKATVAAVLLDHVVSGNVRSTGLANGNVPTLGGDNIVVSGLPGAPKLNGDINITAVDIQGTNGVFHRIDKVIVN
jgi:transforming growth factor-beta-induced protein